MKGRVKHILLPSQLLGKDMNFAIQLSSKSSELSMKEERKKRLFTVDCIGFFL